MPGMTGLELARRVHLERPALPVVLWTGFGGEEAAAAAERLGLAGVLSKPHTLAELGVTAAAALRPAAAQRTGDAS